MTHKTYIMLSPGDVIQAGDEYWNDYKWNSFTNVIGNKLTGAYVARRPAPPQLPTPILWSERAPTAADANKEGQVLKFDRSGAVFIGAWNGITARAWLPLSGIVMPQGAEEVEFEKWWIAECKTPSATSYKAIGRAAWAAAIAFAKENRK